MKIVCLICDTRKPHARNGEEGADWCDDCERLTRNRGIASDNAQLAPGSSLRFKDQRKLYQAKR